MLLLLLSSPAREELASELAELERKVDEITVSNPRVAQEYRCVCVNGRWGGGAACPMYKQDRPAEHILYSGTLSLMCALRWVGCWLGLRL